MHEASGAVGHGLERDVSWSGWIPPLLHSPSLSRSCYPSCWLEFSGVGHGETTHCDNQAVVACLHSRSSKHKGLMHLLRNLAFIEASHGFHLVPRYINTHANHLADDLSRNRVLSFLSKVPRVCPYPTLVPWDVISLLLDPRADWTSRPLQAQFRDTLLKA